jgi:adenylate cyclase class 1
VRSQLSCEIKKLCDKANKFNRLRIQSAQVLMNKDELNVFQTFPLLFHFNLPTLPGYINDDVPTGISQYEVTEKAYQLVNSFLNVNLPESEQQRDIIGMYAMGSTSSIGQCSESDLDIWVCYPHQLNCDRVALLEEKSWLITRWAESLGVELNFFLIPDNKFRINNDAGMTKDSCGSSQHMVLLDEFYRTALRIAGRSILWRLIPIEHEKNYDQYVQALYDNGTLDSDDWLDLGGFHRIPAEEYFGATLWQLYKGIDTPYKAVLKTILMEAYSCEYPKTELVAITYKKRFQTQEYYDEKLDPYCLMLEKVTDYLTSINDLKRIEVARACFYLKTEETLSKVCYSDNTAWRRTILNKFVNQWGWVDEQIVDLDNRKNWKVGNVTKVKDILLETLMTSYRKLLSFARDNNIRESISAEDIGILSRKLYAAHETLPGKVDLINPNISPDLSEPHLSFIQVPEGRKNKDGWYLYNCSLETSGLINTPTLMYAKYISKLISWCHMNGLYEEETKLHLYNQGSDLVDKKLNQFIQDLYSVFPVYVPKASNQALSQPCEIKHLTIFLNVEKDPTRHWKDAYEGEDIENGDILSYGQNNECLIGSIDLIYRNSWNEVRTLHFNNNYAVVDALNTILSKMHQYALPPEQIDLFCYSQHFQEQISQSFKNKLKEYIQLRLDSVSQRSVQTLWTGGRKFGFYFERTGVSLQHLQSTVDIYSHISNKKLSTSVINLKNTFFDQTAEMIESHISEGLIQFFFENYPSGFNVYIANAENEVESFQSFAGSKDDLVQNVNRFYASNNNDNNKLDGQINFNLPQFYEIGIDNNNKLELSSFKSRCKSPEGALH